MLRPPQPRRKSAGSSVGQSIGFLIRKSQVRVLPGAHEGARIDDSAKAVLYWSRPAAPAAVISPRPPPPNRSADSVRSIDLGRYRPSEEICQRSTWPPTTRSAQDWLCLADGSGFMKPSNNAIILAPIRSSGCRSYGFSRTSTSLVEST